MRTLIIAAFLAGLVSADTVVLKNGGRLEGVTTSLEGDKLVVKMQSGTIKLNREDIAKVIHRVTPMEEYELTAAKLKKDDAKGHYELSQWCAENGLKHYEREELEATIAADPEHKEAREALGYEKVGGKWLRGEELLKAKGLVKVDGKWMTKEAAAAVAADKESKRLDREIAEAKRRAEREAKETEADRLREFYESQRRLQERLQDRDFDHRRAPRPYPRYYRDYYSDPWAYDNGTVMYGYSYGSYGYPYSYGRRCYSGYGYRRYVGGSYSPPSYSSYGPTGTFVPGSGGTSPGYYRSSGSFDRGDNPHYGGAR